MIPPALNLAQAAADRSVEILTWLGILVVVALLIVVVGLIARRLFFGESEEAGHVGFSLSDLRQMHAQGQLTDDEFAAAKARMIAQSRAALADDDATTELSTTDPRPDASEEGPQNLDDDPRPDNRDDDAAR